ncbi:MAG TPA: HEAT repeat domain-containing protein [Chloroflexia bacterium]|nr:HEAT repeat domain-containing protein [Chloroflexia bacterium]
MSSLAWDRFYESYFGDPYMAWHDGLDSQALLSLDGEELERAEQMLIDALGSSDYRPAAGLATLRSANAADKLKEALPDAPPSAAIRTAHALWQIERYLPAANTLVTILRTAPFWGDRGDAARLLRDVPTPRVIESLWQAVENDPEDLVRTHAASSLLSMYNIHSEIYDMHPLSIAVMSQDKEERDKAIRELKALIEKEGKLKED